MLVDVPKIITEQDEHGRRRYLAFLLPKESLQEAQKLVMRYKEIKKQLSLSVKVFRKPRSLDANAYCWVLCQAIGEALGIPKERVYRQHVKDVGPFYTAVFDAPEAEGAARCWASNGLGWMAEMQDNYDGTVTAFLYPGSSTYDTAQMSRLLDSLVSDCDDIGLDVQIPDEVRALLHD